MSSSEAMSVPAEVIEASFIPSPDRALVFDARTFLRNKIRGVVSKDVAVHVESAVPGPDGRLAVQCMADRDAFDALTRAGVKVAGYTYQRPFECFTATLSVGEVSATISGRVSDAASRGIDYCDGSDCEYDEPGDEEATLG